MSTSHISASCLHLFVHASKLIIVFILLRSRGVVLKGTQKRSFDGPCYFLAVPLRSQRTFLCVLLKCIKKSFGNARELLKNSKERQKNASAFPVKRHPYSEVNKKVVNILIEFAIQENSINDVFIHTFFHYL
jgi:hypothetical protein